MPPELMTNEGLIKAVKDARADYDILNRMYKSVNDNLQSYIVRTEKLSSLVLFGTTPGAAGAIYRITYPDTLDRQTPVLYAGELKFTVSSALDNKDSMHRLKKEHEKHFAVKVGIDAHNLKFVALNREELPPHPNIGDFICLGDLHIFEPTDPRQLTEGAVQAIWEANRERIAATLSTANVHGGFHDAIVDSVYLDAGTYEGEAMTQANGSSPVWAVCKICGEIEGICIKCGKCDNHCTKVTCDACSQVFHNLGALCGACMQCENCGHSEGCERQYEDDDMLTCQNCGERVDPDDMNSCDFCNDCHLNAGHGYCADCTEHVYEGNMMDCNRCRGCHDDADHTTCVACGAHLDDDEGVMCEGEECGVTVCDDCAKPCISGGKEVMMCPSCSKHHDKAHTAGQTSVTDTVWHQ